MIAAPEDRGNDIVTAMFDVAFPTAARTNGQPSTIVTPSLAYGRGAGAWDLQETFGVALPASGEAAIGRTYVWNNALQYRVGKLWPEVEVNATFYEGGPNAGRRQVFLTPGLLVGRVPLNRRVALAFDAGMPFAVSDFRSSDHNLIASVRLPF